MALRAGAAETATLRSVWTGRLLVLPHALRLRLELRLRVRQQLRRLVQGALHRRLQAQHAHGQKATRTRECSQLSTPRADHVYATRAV